MNGTNKTSLGYMMAAGVLLASASTALLADTVDEYVMRAQSHLQDKKYSASVIELKNALQKDPQNAKARFLLGDVYLAQGDGANAEKEFERALELGSAVEDVMPLLGRALLYQGKASDILQKIKLPDTASAKARAEILSVHGDALVMERNFDEALKQYDAALAIDANNAGAMLGKGRLALLNGKQDQARDWTDKALAQDPDYVDALVVKAELLRSAGDNQKALATYEHAARVRPGYLPVLLGKATSHVALRQFDAAWQDLERVLKVAPQQVMANYLKAVIHVQQKEMVQANEALSIVLKNAPNHPQAQLLAGMLNYIEGKMEQAEYYLRRVVAMAPNHIPARKALAATYLRLKRPKDAINTLDVVGASSNDAQLLALLGSAYLQSGDPDTGNKYLMKAAELAPDVAAVRAQLALGHLLTGDDAAATDELQSAVELDQGLIQADILLVYAHIRAKEFDKALSVANAMVKKNPEDTVALNLLGAVYSEKGELKQAESQFKRIIQVEPTHAGARMALAKLALDNKDFKGAKSYYQQILKHDSKHVPAMMALARLAEQDGGADQALSWVEKARAANDKALEPRVTLVNAYLGRRESLKALAIAREAYGIQPENPLVLEMLGKAQLATDDLASAISTYEILANKLPDSPAAHVLIAQAYITKKRWQDAKVSVDKALSLQPQNAQLKLMSGRIALELNQLTKARKVARELQTTEGASAAGFELEADVYSLEGKHAQAVQAYKKMYEKAPNTNSLLKLVRSMRMAGEGGREALMEEWLKKQPMDSNVRMVLAAAYQNEAGYDNAIRHYLEVAKQLPDNVVANNNLAWLLGERGDPRALEFAEKAYSLAPDNPAVMDTAGWVMVNAGKVNRGLLLLQEASTKAPHMPEIRYHLASALQKAGRQDEAKKELQRLLRDHAEFSERGKAQQLLNSL